jgi:hypothetical protein
MTEPNQRLEATRELAPAFVGLTKDAAVRLATERGLHLRFVDFDENMSGRFALTADLRADRLTVYVRDGVVTQAEAG